MAASVVMIRSRHDLGDSTSMTPEQLRRRAARVRAEFPESRAAELYELAACAQEIEEKLRWWLIISPPAAAPSLVPEENFPF
jgi:hypothetical protein